MAARSKLARGSSGAARGSRLPRGVADPAAFGGLVGVLDKNHALSRLVPPRVGEPCGAGSSEFIVEIGSRADGHSEVASWSSENALWMV